MMSANLSVALQRKMSYLSIWNAVKKASEEFIISPLFQLIYVLDIVNSNSVNIDYNIIFTLFRLF